MNDTSNRKNSYLFKGTLAVILILSMGMFWAGMLGCAYMARGEFLIDENAGTQTMLSNVTEYMQDEALCDYVKGKNDDTKKSNFHYIIYRNDKQVAGNTDTLPQEVNISTQTVKCGKYSDFTFGSTQELGVFVSPYLYTSIRSGRKDVKHDVSAFGISEDKKSFYVKSGKKWYLLSDEAEPQVKLSVPWTDVDVMEESEYYDLDAVRPDWFAQSYGVDEKDIVTAYEFGCDTGETFTLSEGEVKTLGKKDKIAEEEADAFNSADEFITYKPDETEKTYTIKSYYGQVEGSSLSSIGAEHNGKYRIDLTYDDLYARAANQLEFMLSIKPALILAIILGGIAGLVSYMLLLGAAGHHKSAHPRAKKDNYIVCDDGTGVIEKRVLDLIPLDLYALVLLMVEGCAVSVSSEGLIAFLIVGLPVTAVLFVVFSVSAVVNYKVGTFLRNTICYRIYRLVKTALKKAGSMMAKGDSVRDLKRRCITVFAVLFFLHLIGFVAAVTVTPFLSFIAFLAVWAYMGWRMLASVAGIAKIKEGISKVASGDYSYRIDTADMPVDLVQISQDLDHIGAGLDQAVEERLKSERMQTELITNVSHDIRTPLTSIINYVDLLLAENLDNEKANEYLEVINRQSQKLKKLITDLIDASKASSGVIELNLEKINASVLLTQAVGEYSEALMEKSIDMVVESDNEEMYINADAQRLWRIFDNLLGNSVKYGQAGTRAYVDVNSINDGELVQITFRNVSEAPLHISGEELMQRFVRGDESRSTQGSGLGLSIAKSLTEVMGGSFDLTIDGDLFKVQVTFERVAG